MRANGKLLLTGEYFVLDGARALALPTALGQTMRITEEGIDGYLRWKSYDVGRKVWFEGDFELPGLIYLQGTDGEIGIRLQTMLEAICTLYPPFLLEHTCLSVETHLEFSRHWGLGSSSTLIYLLAQWAEVDPYKLLKSTFGGSGYDIAAAARQNPFFYRIGDPPEVSSCPFAPSFADHLYFVYLGQKQNSRDGIALYKEKRPVANGMLEEITHLTHSFSECRDLKDWDALVHAHELVVGQYLGLPRARDLHFSDFWGEIKSLGAWGGDFVVASSDRPEEETRAYFNERGFSVFLPYWDLILSSPAQ